MPIFVKKDTVPLFHGSSEIVRERRVRSETKGRQRRGDAAMIRTNREARSHFEIAIPGKVEDIVGFICENTKISPLDALRQFYQSETYKKLEIETTKYWHWGSVSLYQEFLHEK